MFFFFDSLTGRNGENQTLIWSKWGNRWLHYPKYKQEVDWEDWEKRFEALVAPVRGFYGVSYDEEVKIFKDYIAPTDLTVKIKGQFDNSNI